MEQYVLNTVPESECKIINPADLSSKISWEEEGEIFYLDGVMYDVAKKKIVNGEVLLYCITEERETEIIEDTSLKFSSESNDFKNFALPVIEDYILPLKEDMSAAQFAFSILHSVPDCKLLQQTKNIILPPPRLAGLAA